MFQWSNLAGDENTPCRVRVKWQRSGNKIQKREAFGKMGDTNRTNMASVLRTGESWLQCNEGKAGRCCCVLPTHANMAGEWKVIIYIIYQGKLNF